MIKYDSIFWVTEHRVRCKQTQRPSMPGGATKQFCSPSAHEDTVGQLLEESVAKIRVQEHLNKENVNPAAGKRSSIKKRKQIRIVTDDDLYEVELAPELFESPNTESKTMGARQLRSVRQRKKPKTVKFSKNRTEQEYFQSNPSTEVFGAALVPETKDTKPIHIPTRRPYVPEGEDIPVWAPLSPPSGGDMIQKIFRLAELEKARQELLDSLSLHHEMEDVGYDEEDEEEYHYSGESGGPPDVHVPESFGSGDLDVSEFNASNMEIVEEVELPGYTEPGYFPALDTDRPHAQHVEDAESEWGPDLPASQIQNAERRRTSAFASTASESHRHRRHGRGHMGRKKLSMHHDNVSNFNLQNAFATIEVPQVDGTGPGSDEVQYPDLSKSEPTSIPGPSTEDSFKQWPADERDLAQTLRKSLMPRLRAVDEMDVADRDTAAASDDIPGHRQHEQDGEYDRDDTKGKGKERELHRLSVCDLVNLNMNNLEMPKDHPRGRSRCRSVKWDRARTRRLGRGHQRYLARSVSCRRGRARERSQSPV